MSSIVPNSIGSNRGKISESREALNVLVKMAQVVEPKQYNVEVRVDVFGRKLTCDDFVAAAHDDR